MDLNGVTPNLVSLGAGLRCPCGRPLTGKARQYCSKRCKDTDYNRRRPVHREPVQGGLFAADRELGAELDRRQNRADAVLERLRQGPASTMELVRVGGVRFGARLLELRRAGHRIETEHALDHAVYRLTEGEP